MTNDNPMMKLITLLSIVFITKFHYTLQFNYFDISIIGLICMRFNNEQTSADDDDVTLNS